MVTSEQTKQPKRSADNVAEVAIVGRAQVLRSCYRNNSGGARGGGIMADIAVLAAPAQYTATVV